MTELETAISEEEHSALKREESRYHQLVSEMLNAFALHEIICDEQGNPVDYRYLEVNLAFEQMTGLKAESMIGHTVLEILPNTESYWIETYGKVALTGKSVRFENYSQELDRHYAVTAFRPAPGQFASSFTDITEHKKTAEALIAAREEAERSKDHLEQVLNAIGDPVFVKDDESQLLQVNDAFCTIFDLSRDEIMGKTLAEHVPPDERAHFLSIDSQVIADGKESIVEETLTVRGRPTRTIQTRKSRFVGNDDKEYLVGIIRDISERKEAEIALAAEKEQLAVTLESIGDGVITTDLNGHIVMLNRVAEELTGWRSHEAVGRPLSDVFRIIHEHTRQPTVNPVEKVLTDDEIVHLANNTCLITRDGQEIVIADSAAPIRDQNGQTLGVVLVFRDMTVAQRLEDAQRKSQKLESLGVLAGGIAHDFNNLLGAIFGYTEIALSIAKGDSIPTYLKKSMRNIDRARALTQQLLTFARGGEPNREVADLFPFVQQTVQFALSGSSALTRFQIPDDLWPCNFDKNQIGQVVDNLTINAQQAMPQGGEIQISAQNVSLSENDHVSLAAGSYVKLSVRDQGAGISREHLANIFDPYFTTKADGHGLGLATCYSIIRRHDGLIDVESELGVGSAFHVYLPAAPQGVPRKPERLDEDHTGEGVFLIMDDEAVLRDVLEEILSSFGYEVVATKNGEEAIDFCVAHSQANRKLAGMIFDLTVPGGLGGKEAIPVIREGFPDTPAFVISGYSSDPVMANPAKYGFTASLRKPFTIGELSDMLATHLG